MSVFASLPESFLYGVAAGSLGFYATLGATQVMLQQVAPRFVEQRIMKLAEKPRYFFWVLGPSTVHGLVQVIGTVAFLPKMINDPIVGAGDSIDTRLWVDYGLTGLGPSFYSGIFVGYLMADFAFLRPRKLGTQYVMHHLSAIVCWTMAQSLQSFQFVAQLLQFCEFSTIFMNLRQFYLTAGYDSSSKPVVWSSLAFFVSFGLVRVAPLPWILYQWLTQDFVLVRDNIGWGAALSFSAFFAVHTTLQVMWFRLMVQRVLAKFTGAGGSDSIGGSEGKQHPQSD